MHLFALDPWWNEFYTAGGFFVGVIGLVVGIAGFWYTVVQVWNAQAAAEAAEAAAKKTLAESKTSYERFVGAYASRLAAELLRAVNTKDWKLAELRAHDLAELLGTLPAPREPARDAVAELRRCGQAFADKAAGTKTNTPTKKQWLALVTRVQARLDELRAPFRGQSHDETGSRYSGQNVPGDRAEPPRQDPGPTSELGQS